MPDLAVTTPHVSPERVAWRGRTDELYALLATNVLLKVVTLGFFTFWARTRKRQYFWNRVEFLGDRFEYHGRGIELFLGLLFVAAAILLPLAIVSGLLQLALPVKFKILSQVAYGIVLLFLTGAGVFRATRYRLARTSWRGLRFGLDGRAGLFGRQYLLRMLLMMITLTLYRPWFDAWYHRALLDQAQYGDARVESRPEGSGLFGTYFVCWLLAVPTLSLSFAAYRVAFLRHLASRTSLAGLTMRFDARTRDLVKLRVGNFLLYAAVGVVALGASMVWAKPFLSSSRISLATKPYVLGAVIFVLFGLAVTSVLPLLWQRRMRFFCTHFGVGGVLAVDRIRSAARDDVETGEGLASAFDFDAVG
jgi:uncharacterized membrane protein YjgN (DUF898 family)